MSARPADLRRTLWSSEKPAWLFVFAPVILSNLFAGRVKVEQTKYKDFEKCYRMTNGGVELIATSSVGPRVIHFGFVGQQNLFGAAPGITVDVGDDQWKIYGGHRLWHSPEMNPRSYSPDNKPVKAEVDGSTLRLTQDTETMTGIQKEMTITLDEKSNRVEVMHRLTNRGVWPVTLAAWALTVMNKDGTAIVPIPQGDPDDLLPNWTMTLWPYTDLADPRVHWGTKFFTLTQDPDRSTRFKIGLQAQDGWVAYARNNQLFVKTFAHETGVAYPDGGCSLEIFTNDDILEVESLSPLVELGPGKELEHIEVWYLFDTVSVGKDDASIDATVRKLVETARAGE
ncbi:MAG: DUF4380 domain-containing protein [Armatimonadetes bacterium]|nr:DUF4380 domain-containing protein [Armatimonadota bacterium]PIU67241.1 MAG: hypothetical protein COS85_01480 [Armatimonadetes bacterium CG07_land_8_20_14_0_80_59_28]PIX41099.1 MAG: hypothetical protein COZ56_12965 [Armatimonadetes bacterium CG_4_8_14_3_um_filter_58_9]PIY44686.1 MAG: hypothetical protein COZ05_07475 [Armatimonadetes bacterium CG_4_10_14_3_um_filter_59_10]